LKVNARCDAPNVWRLASHFRLTRDVDYIADRIGNEIISESGKACVRASDRAQCEAALALAQDDPSMFKAIGHHLVTIEGDSVRLWFPPALSLLGEIDTTAEAIWLAFGQGFDVPCDSAVYDTGHDTFGITGDLMGASCAYGMTFGLELQPGGGALGSCITLR
jgi:hypothetical protein